MDTNTTSDWVVLKFGGTSVAAPDRWATIATVVQQRLDAGERPLLVCSALAGVSDLLERLLREAVTGSHEATLTNIAQRHRELAAALGVETSALDEGLATLQRLATGISLIEGHIPRIWARVMAQGELLSTRLGAAYLRSRGLDVTWVDARDCLTAQSPPQTDEQRRYLSAVCLAEPDPALQAQLGGLDAAVLLTQGFIARDGTGETVLLGRGGSDTSAAYFAGRLQARRCEIWTDVPGIYTANPRQVPSARLLRELDYAEAQELATMGARVLHPRCLAPLRRQGIPLQLFSTLEPDRVGTRITAHGATGGPRVKAISSKGGVTLVIMETLGMWQQVGFLADAFAVFKARGLSIDLVSTSEANVTVSLDAAGNALDDTTLASLVDELGQHCRASVIKGCSAVSLVGRQIRAVLHRLGPILEVFEAQPVHLVSQAASDLNLTFVVDQSREAPLVRQLHGLLFGRAEAQPDLFGPAWQADAESGALGDGAARWWERRRGELLDLADEVSPVYAYDAETLRAAAEGLLALDAVDSVLYSVKANANAEILRLFESLGLGFECVSLQEVELLFALFDGLDPSRVVFTPNFVPRAEYESARALGVHVTLDNLFPLQAWPEVFADQSLFVRLDPGEGRGHHAHVRTAGTASKFGISVDQLDELSELLERARVRVVGLHAHAGSGIRDPDNWSDVAAFLAQVADRFPDVDTLDLGGGLGVPERAHQSALDVAALQSSLAGAREAWPRYRLWLEPGRFLVAQAGVLLARVTQLKSKGSVQYVGIETGMNSLIRPALYGAYHEIVNLTRLDAPRTTTATVVGPICETGDTLGYSRPLPVCESGDVLLIATAGAYGRVMSSSYNQRPPAAERLLT